MSQKDVDKLPRTTIFRALATGMMISSLMLLCVASFLPTYVQDKTWKGEAPADIVITLIISINFIAQLIFAPMNSCIKNKIGAKNTILLGFTVLTLTTFGLGFIARFDDPVVFSALGLVFRFLMGFG